VAPIGRLAGRVTLWALACAFAVGAAQAQETCEVEFESTFDLIQNRIFDSAGCNTSFCHSGDFPAGGLDLTAGRSYGSLLNQRSATVDGAVRLVPGQKDESLLWVNVAAATLPDEWSAPIRPMPPGSLLPPLSLDQLEVLRLWIESGAPERGVVAGTGKLLDACLPPPKPIEIEPLPPPPANVGVQIKMPRWEIDAHREREVCFASYYDVTSQVPDEFLGSNHDTFVYNRAVLRQDPLSHHLIAQRYDGPDLPDDPDQWPPRRCQGGSSRGERCATEADCAGSACVAVWPPFFCQGGARDGETCNPIRRDDCGSEAVCVTRVESGVACVGFGPPDTGLGLSAAGFVRVQETASVIDFADGVYDELPLKGMVLWNSHAFNLTDEPGKLEAWLNFEFAAHDERRFRAETIFDTSDIFAADTLPFRAEEVCHHHVLPYDAQLFELSSHTHKRGKRFRTLLGAWRCDGGPRDGDDCSPFGPDVERGTADLCAGAPCRSRSTPAACDCDRDGGVAVGELVTGLNIALAAKQVADCPDADANRDGSVSVEELLLGVASAMNPERDPDASLLYVNLVYNDPPSVRFDPPLAFPGVGSPADERTLTYCSVYDNGSGNDADTVKRRSTSPEPPLGLPLGGPCNQGEACTNAGRIGDPCSGNSDDERDASCNNPGASDGLCDACTLKGGVTTEDEMFILLGRFFIAP
jgi:hypothetical protein